MTVSELAELIENIHQAVDETVFGPMITYGGTESQPTKIVSQVASTIFMETLRGALAKLDTVNIVADAPPSDIVTNIN